MGLTLFVRRPSAADAGVGKWAGSWVRIPPLPFSLPFCSCVHYVGFLCVVYTIFYRDV
jgi:hypothetical protein